MVTLNWPLYLPPGQSPGGLVAFGAPRFYEIRAMDSISPLLADKSHSPGPLLYTTPVP